MEFNDGSKYRVLTNPQAQVQAGRTMYAYKACGASGDQQTVDSAFSRHRIARDSFKATLIYQFVYVRFSPEASANFFVDTIGSLCPGEMVALDPEAGGGFTAANVLDYCRRWLTVVESKLDTKAWIYTAKDFSAALSVLTKDRVLWIPRYNDQPPSWSRWDVWQKSEAGAFPGCAEGIGDLNYTPLSVEELLAKCGVSTPPKENTMPTVEQFLNVCRGELGKGQYEFPVGSNKTKYGKWFGMDGQPWCAMGISWACAQVSIGWRFASTQEARRVAQRDGKWSSTPKPGMVAMHSSGPSTGHVGVVEFVHTDGTITTLEWNTSPDSSGSQRDGDGMYRKRRSRSYWLGYIALSFSAQEQPQPTPQKEEDMGPASVLTTDGRLFRIVVGDEKAAWEHGRKDHPETNAKGWRKLGGIWTGGLSAVPNAGGGYTLSGRGSDGHLWEFIVDVTGTVTAKNDLGGHIYPPG